MDDVLINVVSPIEEEYSHAEIIIGGEGWAVITGATAADAQVQFFDHLDGTPFKVPYKEVFRLLKKAYKQLFIEFESDDVVDKLMSVDNEREINSENF